MSLSRRKGFNIIHQTDLLNGLLAISTTLRDPVLDDTSDIFAEGYKAGFDNALLAVAQMLGQSETFLAQRAKLKSNSH